MTPKDEVTPLYHDIETDTNVRLVYGEAQYTYLHAWYIPPDPLSQAEHMCRCMVSGECAQPEYHAPG